MITRKKSPINLLDDVFFYHPKEGWTRTYVVSSRKGKILVAGYGPPLPTNHVLQEIDYTQMKHNGSLADYTATFLKQ